MNFTEHPAFARLSLPERRIALSAVCSLYAESDLPPPYHPEFHSPTEAERLDPTLPLIFSFGAPDATTGKRRTAVNEPLLRHRLDGRLLRAGVPVSEHLATAISSSLLSLVVDESHTAAPH